MPTTEAEIEARVNEEMKKVMEDVKRFKDPKLSPAQWLNDLASERRAEARMS
jgi:hypothetical protein